MRRQIVITVILLIATAFVTVVYFKNLNPPGTHVSKVMNTIPDNAAFILEFNNDKSFYDIFNTNPLFKAVVGGQQIDELDSLRQQLFQNPQLAQLFTGQNIYVSLHPSQKGNGVNLLITLSPVTGFEPLAFDKIIKQPNSNLVITVLQTKSKQGYEIYLKALKKSFYLVKKEGNIFSGSFSAELTDQSSLYKSKDGKQSFVLLSEQQNANSLANLYVNYSQLEPLVDKLFKNKNTDIFKSLRLLPGLAALSLNYRSDALMFNGSTNIQVNQPKSYLDLFANQQPVINHLKDIFPSTTAYSVNFAVSDPLKFGSDLSKWHIKAGLKVEKDALFDKIRAETGINLITEFNNLLGNEFAVVTTRYLEKFAVVSVKDGSKMSLALTNISKMTDENSGQLNYDKLPFFLLGDSFSIFKHPYFIIIDNYLILANSESELKSYSDIYLNRKFLSKNNQYNQFDNLLAGQSNIAFLFHLKNAMPILQRDLYPDVYAGIKANEPGWKDFYSIAWQFTAADKNFYTNFCIKLNTDTTVVN